jgi:hypothetical protein
MRVFVLLFNPRTENEGIHTLRIGDRNTILMFESEDDATRYALLLEAQDFASPTPEALESEEIEEFCRDAGYDSKLIHEGELAIPPETNLEELEWQADVSAEADPDNLSQSELDRIRRQLEGLI